jgi:hypothetical protein
VPTTLSLDWASCELGWSYSSLFSMLAPLNLVQFSPSLTQALMSSFFLRKEVGKKRDHHLIKIKKKTNFY